MIVAAASEGDMGKILRMEQCAGFLVVQVRGLPTDTKCSKVNAVCILIICNKTAGHNIHWVQCCQRVQRCPMLRLLLLFFFLPCSGNSVSCSAVVRFSRSEIFPCQPEEEERPFPAPERLSCYPPSHNIKLPRASILPCNSYSRTAGWNDGGAWLCKGFLTEQKIITITKFPE